MRAVCTAFAAIGGCALVVAVAIGLATGGQAGAADWVLVGPAPFYVAGLVGVVRGPGRRVAAWLLASGAMFALAVCLGDVVPLLAPDSSYAWAVVLGREWAGNASAVAGIGLIGLFPTGMPQRAGER